MLNSGSRFLALASSFACTLCLTSFVTSPSATAATITLAGSLSGVAGDDNDEIDRWRTNSVPKTLDLDLDNVYGTAGYVTFATDALGNANAGTVVTNTNPFTYVNGTRRTLASIPSYLTFNVPTVNTAGIANSYGYKMIDDPTVAPDATVANVESGGFLRNTALNTEATLFDIVIGADFPTGGLRLGLLLGNTDVYSGSFRLEQTVGGIANASASQSAAAPLEMAFFDISGAVAGDTFRVYATKNGTTGNANVLLGGLTFDAIPEPATASSLLLGLAALATGARRRRG